MRVLKIRILNNKKLILFISIIFFTSFYLLIPTSLGYGSGFDDAQILANGTYYETLESYDDYAYYKVYCRPGDYLYVEVDVNYPTYDVDLRLYDQYYSVEDSSYYDGDDWVSTDVYSRTHYYIRVERYYPSYGDIPFTLEISGATGSSIPGFGVLSLLIVTISTISLIYLRVKRKK